MAISTKFMVPPSDWSELGSITAVSVSTDNDSGGGYSVWATDKKKRLRLHVLSRRLSPTDPASRTTSSPASPNGWAGPSSSHASHAEYGSSVTSAPPSRRGAGVTGICMLHFVLSNLARRGHRCRRGARHGYRRRLGARDGLADRRRMTRRHATPRDVLTHPRGRRATPGFYLSREDPDALEAYMETL
jgi:hypothetical protein